MNPCIQCPQAIMKKIPDADLVLLSFHPLFVASFLQEHPVRVHNIILIHIICSACSVKKYINQPESVLVLALFLHDQWQSYPGSDGELPLLH